MKAFASFEAMLALLFAIVSFLALLPLFSPQQSQGLYEYQLAQDFAEISVSQPRLKSAIADFRGGSQSSKEFLGSEYARILGGVGDYCLELDAGERLEVNCERAFSSTAAASRILFDGEDFFEMRILLSFNPSRKQR